MLLRSLLLRTLSETIYAFLVLLTTVAAGLSCTALLSQAVRTSPTRNYANPNAIIIGVAYTVLVGTLLAEGNAELLIDDDVRVWRIRAMTNRFLSWVFRWVFALCGVWL